MVKVKAHELREKSKAELLGQLDELKKELLTLRVAKVTGGAPSKLARIGVVRKNIARVLTVYNQKQKEALRHSLVQSNAKQWPKDLRKKQTRAIRRRLTSAQLNKKTERAAKKAANFPQRRFAVKA